MKFYLKRLFIIFMIIFTSSCTQDELARTTVSTGEKAEPVKIEQVVGCSIYSPPPLDILILYDNSTSLYYFKRNIKAAIRELGTRLTNFEDFRICIAPLIYQGEPNREFKCQSYVQTNPQQNSASVNPVGLNDVSIDGITTNVYAEKSFERVVTMLKKNKYTAAEIDPIFRPEAVTVAIVVSNGDDTDVCRDSWGHADECGKINYWSSKLLDFKNELALKQIRFISVVNKSEKPACGGTARYPGIRYSLFSRVVYEAQGLTSDNRPTKDSYDLCEGDLTQIFSQISDSINNYKVGHKYNSWPLGNMTGKDPIKLKVWKGIDKVELIQGDTQNGFIYDATIAPKNIRESPPQSIVSPPEIYAGPFITLYGNGKVIYPECLYIKKENYTKYYGYIVMNDEPDLSNLKVIINGKEISQDSVNGWTFLGFKPSIFLLVKSPLDLSPGPVPDENPQKYYKTGYVLKLHGSAVYTDGAKIELFYKKAKQP